jgi:hypothetical protein
MRSTLPVGFRFLRVFRLLSFEFVTPGGNGQAELVNFS